MKNILTILMLLGGVAHAGQWFTFTGNDSTLSTGTVTVTNITLSTTTNNNLFVLTTAQIEYANPQNAVSFETRINTNAVNTARIGYDYLPANNDLQTMSASGSTNGVVSGSQTVALVRDSGAFNARLNNWTILVYADNEFGPSDQRIISQLALAVTNLQTQITTVSNQLASAQSQIITNATNISTLQAQYATLTSQYTTLSNQLSAIPSTSSAASQAQINDLQGQINNLNSKIDKRTSGILGGSMWNDIISFGGIGIGLFNTGNGLLNGPSSPINRAPVSSESMEPRPGYYE